MNEAHHAEERSRKANGNGGELPGRDIHKTSPGAKDSIGNKRKEVEEEICSRSGYVPTGTSRTYQSIAREAGSRQT